MEPIFMALAILLSLFIIVNLWLTYKIFSRSGESFLNELNNEVKNFEKYLQKVETGMKDEFSRNRDEISKNFKDLRTELGASFKNFEDSILKRIAEMSEFQKGQFEGFSLQLNNLTRSNEEKIEKMACGVQERLNLFNDQLTTSLKLTGEELSKSLKSFEDRLSSNFKEVNETQAKKFEALVLKQDEMIKVTDQKIEKIRETNEAHHTRMNNAIQEKLNYFQEQLNSNSKSNREELAKSLKNFEETFAAKVNDFNELQKQKFDGLTNRQNELVQLTERRLGEMRETLEQKLKTIQDDSNAKLEIIRQTVDEKLHKTLEQRLGDSFKIVSERLELVHKGLGEMQNLAAGVGDLKKVLSNVKNRGVLGEYQLENILEQLLTNEQFGRNVKTKHDSQTLVEFAIKLPGKDDKKPVWLPVDSKFPTEHYLSLTEAYEQGDQELIGEKRKMLERCIRQCARDINEKYIDPPNTTCHIEESVHIFSDPCMFKTIIRNLLSNSVKYCFEKGKISVAAAEEGTMVRITVSDNGVGMPAETLEKLFRIDCKVSKKGTQGETGSGFGLILCAEFAAKNGGSIRAESERGKGSAFTVRMPRHVERESSSSAANGNEAAAGGRP